jgi:hypothetical protein
LWNLYHKWDNELAGRSISCLMLQWNPATRFVRNPNADWLQACQRDSWRIRSLMLRLGMATLRSSCKDMPSRISLTIVDLVKCIATM